MSCANENIGKNHLELIQDLVFVDQFLDKIHKYPFLFDEKHKHFKDAKKKGRHMERIAAELNVQGNIFFFFQIN